MAPAYGEDVVVRRRSAIAPVTPVDSKGTSTSVADPTKGSMSLTPTQIVRDLAQAARLLLIRHRAYEHPHC